MEADKVYNEKLEEFYENDLTKERIMEFSIWASTFMSHVERVAEQYATLLGYDMSRSYINEIDWERSNGIGIEIGNPGYRGGDTDYDDEVMPDHFLWKEGIEDEVKVIVEKREQEKAAKEEKRKERDAAYTRERELEQLERLKAKYEA